MKCKHAVCKCQADDVQKDGYCSDPCRNHQVGPKDKCVCGHADCK